MRFGRVQVATLFLVVLVGSTASLVAFSKKKDAKNVAAEQTDERKRALHALNRLNFGPRPGEVQQVADMDVDKWIEQQLHPEKIDDGAMQARLAPFPHTPHGYPRNRREFPPTASHQGSGRGEAGCAPRSRPACGV